jgi:hypothetical protein
MRQHNTEVIGDELQRSGQSQRSEFDKKLTPFAVGLSVAATAFVAGWMGRGPVDALTYEPSQQEVVIAQALTVDDTVDPKVLCLSRDDMRNRQIVSLWEKSSPAGARPYFAPFGLGKDIVWLQQEICDEVTEFARNPPSKAQDITALSVATLATVEHEYQHVARDEHDESLVECAMVQTVGRLAVKLGMDDNLAPKVTMMAADFHNRLFEGAAVDPSITAMGGGRTSEGMATLYRFDDRCVPGGEGDLGLFPADKFPVIRQ